MCERVTNITDKVFFGRCVFYFVHCCRKRASVSEYFLSIMLLLSPHYIAFPMCIAANCSLSFVYCVIILGVSLLPHVYCFTMCVLLSYIL